MFILFFTGIQDCPDDEINCSYKQQTQTQIIKKVKEKTIIVKKCPEPKCPPGFYVKITSAKKSKQSAMLNPPADSPLGNDIDGIYRDSNEDNTDIHSKLPLPGDVKKTKKTDDFTCMEYNCIPEKVISITKTEQLTCPPPSCPSGYEVVFEAQPLAASCSKYKCELIPKRDVVCNITGRTFSTFDGIEYKYDICDHILARDLSSNNWTISSEYFTFFTTFSIH